MVECLGHEDHQFARCSKKAKDDKSNAMDNEDKVERGADMVNQGEEGYGQGDGQSQGPGEGQEGEGQREGDKDEGWEDYQGMAQEGEDVVGQGAKEGNGEAAAEGRGQQGKAERAAPLAVEAPYKMDMGGKPIVCHVRRLEEQGNARQAEGQGRALERKGRGGPNT